jgi:hypothetical protein
MRDGRVARVPVRTLEIDGTAALAAVDRELDQLSVAGGVWNV